MRLRRQHSPGQPRHPSSLRSQASSLGLLIFVVLLLRSFVAEAFFIPSESMQPALEVGDRVLVSRFTYGLRVPLLGWKLSPGRAPRPGDVVVFVHPKTGEDLIKRVVAVAGDTVALHEGRLEVNGFAIAREPLAAPCRLAIDGEGEVPCRAFTEEQRGRRYAVWQRIDRPGFDLARQRVPAGHAFVLGDNRDNSNDSRYFGPVPYRNLKGRAEAVLWSWTFSDGVRGDRWFRSLR